MQRHSPSENHERTTFGLFGDLTAFVLGHRVWAVCVLLVLVLSVAAGGLLLRADFSAKLFYGTHDPETAYLADYLERWGADDVMAVVIDGNGETLLTPKRLELIEAARERIRTHSSVGETRTVADHKRARASFFGVRSVPLLETMPTEPEELLTWQEGVLADDVLVPGLVSPSGEYASIIVSLTMDTDDMSANRKLVYELKSRLADLQGKEGLTFYFAGIPSLRGSVIDAIVGDQLILVPISGSLVVLLLIFMFRSRHGVLVPVVASVVPLLMLLGAMGYLKESLGLLNQTYLVLIPAIAIADAIHLVSRYHEESRKVIAAGEMHSRETRRIAIIAAMRHMGLACLFTSVTTIIGFLSLGFTGMEVLRHYGFYAALGIFFAYFTVLFIVPLTLSVTRKGAPLGVVGEAGLMKKLLLGCADLAYKHPRYSLVCTTAMVLLAVAGGSLVTVDTKFADVLAKNHPVSKANGILDRELGGVVGLELEFTGAEGAMANPEMLARLQRLEASIQEYPTVRTTAGPALMVRLLNEQVRGQRELDVGGSDIEGLYRLADVDSGRIVLVDEDRSTGRVIVRMKDEGSKKFLESVEVIEKLAKEHVRGMDVDVHLTGTTFVSYRGVNLVTWDLQRSLGSALLVIALLIAVLFRSVRLGLVSLIPNCIPLVLAYGTMGVLGWRLDAAPAVVFTVALGLGVDATIHVLARFTEERNHGSSPSHAVHMSVLHSGRAIAISSVILAVAFAVNSFSSFPDNVVFGVLGAMIVMGAFLSNLIVLPSLLALMYKGDARSEQQAMRA